MYVRHIIKQNYTLDVAQHTFSQRNKAKNKSKTKKTWGWEEEVGWKNFEKGGICSIGVSL